MKRQEKEKENNFEKSYKSRGKEKTFKLSLNSRLNGVTW
jgi:hypothetical protein